jgi:hypothetical protein
MSGLVVGAVFASGLYKGADLMVMVKLADYADDNGLAYPGYDTLARMAGLEVRSVKRIIKRLIEDGRDPAQGLPGAITKTGKGGRGRSNRYEINLMRLEAAKLTWYRNPGAPDRFKSFEAMAADPAFRPLLAKALPGLPPLPSEKGDAKKGDSGDTVSPDQKGDSGDTVSGDRKGDSEIAKGDSHGLNSDRRDRKTVTGESPESIIESLNDSGAHARASCEAARAAPSPDNWREVRGLIKQQIGEAVYAEAIARLRYPGQGLIIAPDPNMLDQAVRVAGELLKEKGFSMIVSEGGGREVTL